jgi:excisionase family DNA binding protein
MTTGNFLTVQEFCDAFRVSRTTLYRQVAAGALSLVKVGRATRIRRADAEAWQASLPTERRADGGDQ